MSSTHEESVGSGLWNNKESSARGLWWFAQYKWFLQSCKSPIEIFDGTLVPIVGAFARGDFGNSSQHYSWNNWGIGPQAGAMWSGVTDSGYPHSAQFLMRALYYDMRGKNGLSGYQKSEGHIMPGYYTEYIRRFKPDMMWLVYSEGWIDANNWFDSTWSGDEVSNPTSFYLGAKLHKDWNDEWANRFGAQVGFSPENNVWGLNFNAEARYNDWIIFGPSLDYTLLSDISGAAGGFNYGPFFRIELNQFFKEKYQECRMKAVTSASINLLSR